MKHTPTPWIINKARTIRNGTDYFNCEILSTRGNIIAFTEDNLKEKDFEHIVRVVNTNDELLEAAKDAAIILDSMFEKQTIYGKDGKSRNSKIVLKNIQQAISKAEKGEV